MNFPLSSYPVCPLLDARKSEVYAALYNCSTLIPTPLINDCVLPPNAIFDKIAAVTAERVIFVGEGAVRYHDQIAEQLGEQAIFAPFSLHSSRAANGILLALHASRHGRLLDPSELLPVYLRAADAKKISEINKLL